MTQANLGMTRPESKLTFLLAALHARHAVEFFFGLLTPVEV
jgi:hypothetical protein